MTGRGPSRVAIVQRNRPHVHETLQPFARRNFIEVWWDRREADRRRTSQPIITERRQADRRREPPAVWSSLGFMLLPHPVDGASSSAVRIPA
jgi:hypothetical protein